jgi:hypothetical protein
MWLISTEYLIAHKSVIWATDGCLKKERTNFGLSAIACSVSIRPKTLFSNHTQLLNLITPIIRSDHHAQNHQAAHHPHIPPVVLAITLGRGGMSTIRPGGQAG